jgi:DNA polymerase I-like protein with 3'-5' exonuclease and polymerase domains
MTSFIWVFDGAKVSDEKRIGISTYLSTVKVPTSTCYFHALGFGDNWEIPLLQKIRTVQPKILVCSSDKLLQKFHPGTPSVFTARGGVYFWEELGNLPIVCINDLQANYWQSEQNKIPDGYFRWLFLNDLMKVRRWLTGTQKKQPKFTFKICETLADLLDMTLFLYDCQLISEDSETKDDTIRCVTLTGLHRDGTVRTYCVPFYNAFKPNGNHWATEEDEVYAWNCIKDINSLRIPKTFQFGGYDIAYFMRYHCPPADYILDSMHLWHSIYSEARKSIATIASIECDYYTYWKDEIKGEKQQNKFASVAAQSNFWVYACLDSYYGLINTIRLTNKVAKNPWALENYKKEFALQVGPATAGSMRGFRVDHARLATMSKRLLAKAEERKEIIRVMTDEPEFNPGSPKQLAHILYKVLRAKIPQAMQKKVTKKEKDFLKKGKNVEVLPVDEYTMKLVAQQHPIYDQVISAVYDYKKPLNNHSKYCEAKLYNGRFMYGLGSAGTETGRFNCTHHQFWVGNQVQNVPERVGDFIVADPGYVFFEPDFSGSDAWFVAAASGDERMRFNLLSGKDMHCLHASWFFKETYEAIMEGVKNNIEVYAHPVTGKRQIAKRIGHGKNYDMMGIRLYLLMGRQATIAAALAMGYENPYAWSDNQFGQFCQGLLDDYDKMYPQKAAWGKRMCAEGAKNGNLITCAFDRTRLFFGSLTDGGATQREALAYIGQGGTAGNVNRCLLRLYYDYANDNDECVFLTQTHDSMLFQIKIDRLHYWAENILTLMRQPITINDWTFTVPVAAKAGFSWRRGLTKYSPQTTLDALWDHEMKTIERYHVAV